MNILDRLINARAEKLLREQMQNFERIGAIRERMRIGDIIVFGLDNDDLQTALNLALKSELSADDAIAIMTARDGRAPIMPN